MRGTASISREQLHAIYGEISVNELCEPEHPILTVDIYPSLTQGGTVRVGLHRKFAHSAWFGVARDGSLMRSCEAA